VRGLLRATKELDSRCFQHPSSWVAETELRDPVLRQPALAEQWAAGPGPFPLPDGVDGVCHWHSWLLLCVLTQPDPN